MTHRNHEDEGTDPTDSLTEEPTTRCYLYLSLSLFLSLFFSFPFTLLFPLPYLFSLPYYLYTLGSPLSPVLSALHTSICFAHPIFPFPIHISPPILLRWWAVRHGPINKGMCVEFEQHVRCLMATGATARQTRESLLLSATHFLGGAT